MPTEFIEFKDVVDRFGIRRVIAILYKPDGTQSRHFASVSISASLQDLVLMFTCYVN